MELDDGYSSIRGCSGLMSPSSIVNERRDIALWSGPPDIAGGRAILKWCVVGVTQGGGVV